MELTDLIKAQEITLPPTKTIDNATTFIVKPYFAKTLNKTLDQLFWEED